MTYVAVNKTTTGTSYYFLIDDTYFFLLDDTFYFTIQEGSGIYTAVTKS